MADGMEELLSSDADDHDRNADSHTLYPALDDDRAHGAIRRDFNRNRRAGNSEERSVTLLDGPPGMGSPGAEGACQGRQRWPVRCPCRPRSPQQQRSAVSPRIERAANTRIPVGGSIAHLARRKVQVIQATASCSSRRPSVPKDAVFSQKAPRTSATVQQRQMADDPLRAGQHPAHAPAQSDPADYKRADRLPLSSCSTGETPPPC